MQASFWGVRGSVPWAGPALIRHGSNTPCLEIRDDRTDALIVLDAGTGLVGLGEALAGEGRTLPILLTHYHWDHIQGLPSFAPMWSRGWTLEVHGPTFKAGDVRHVRRIFEPPFFTRPSETPELFPELHPIAPGRCDVGGVSIAAVELNHPGGAMAYRVRGTAGDLVYATDHEFGDPVIDERLAAFARGASALVSDAHFTPEEEPAVKGWGHGTWARAADFAAANSVQRLWLFHHKPGRSDAELDRIVGHARAIFPATSAAAEGLRFDF